MTFKANTRPTESQTAHAEASKRRLRELSRNGRLDPAIIRIMNAADPAWQVDPRTTRWLAKLACLDRYVEEHGTARVPQAYDKDGDQLGKWVNSMRNAYRDGVLNAAQITALEARTGWLWSSHHPTSHKDDGWSPPATDEWAVGLACLDRFAAREGHAIVPKKHRESGYPLGLWVDTNRSANRAGTLTAEQTAALNAWPGWHWRVGRGMSDEKIRIGLGPLDAYVAREGHAQVPQAHHESGYRLGAWVNNVRVAYQAGSLTAVQITALEFRTGWTWSTRRSAAAVVAAGS